MLARNRREGGEDRTAAVIAQELAAETTHNSMFEAARGSWWGRGRLLESMHPFCEDPEVEVAGEHEDELAAVRRPRAMCLESISGAAENQVSSAASFARSMAPRTNRLVMTTRAPRCATRHGRVVGSVVVVA